MRVLGIQQDFRFPTVYFSERKVNKANFQVVSSAFDIQKIVLERKVTNAYYDYQIAREKEVVYKRLDSLYSNFSLIAARRFELGETNYLAKITAVSMQKQINLKYLESKHEVALTYGDLSKVVQSEDLLIIVKEAVLKTPLNRTDMNTSVEMSYYQNRVSLLKAQHSFKKQQLLPDISFNYFQGTNPGLNSSLYGYQLGLKIPIFFGGQSSRIKAAGIAENIAFLKSKEHEIQLNVKYNALNIQRNKLSKTLEYYEQEGAALSDEILKTANGSFRNGEIDFYQYIQSLESAYEVKIDYLNKLNQYNKIVTEINYLTL